MAILQNDEELLQDLTSSGLRYADLEREWQAAVADPVSLDAPLDFGDAVEQSDTARILDACGNRAREALRVIEDYARFVLDDAFLCRQLKQLRHDLAEAMTELGQTHFLSSRDTLVDVGTGITTSREHVRLSLTDVLCANAKRLQEALRSLEEYGKLYGPDLGRRLESLRYSSYTLERACTLGATGRSKLSDANVYVLLSASCQFGLERTILAAAEGGAAVIQLREKALPDRELILRARDVRRWTRAAGVLFIVNDRPDIARLADADGVHLGQDDLPVREARRVLGPDAIIGVSTHDLEHVRRAVLDGASYIGVGPTFPSPTKDFPTLAGLSFVRAATAETSLPAFVLGGVTVANVGQVVAAGARRVAVGAAVARADDPRAATAALRTALP
jgi:thiamine-phosphate pyrophosphorylase